MQSPRRIAAKEQRCESGGEPDFAPSFRLREATSGKPL
jgi:hypothetical protein